MINLENGFMMVPKRPARDANRSEPSKKMKWKTSSIITRWFMLNININTDLKKQNKNKIVVLFNVTKLILQGFYFIL